MLSAADIMAGKIAVQLGLAGGEEVRALLREIDEDPRVARDLVNRLTDSGRLDEDAIARVRHRVGLYERVRSEATYLRQLERRAGIRKDVVAHLIHQLEGSAYRRRLGDVLVRRGKLTLEQDRSLQRRVEASLRKDDDRVVERYRGEDFAGVERPLIPGSRLEPQDFKISTLFRARETRDLVSRAELQSLRAEAGGDGGPTRGGKEGAASAGRRRPQVDMPAADLDASSPAPPAEDADDDPPTFTAATRRADAGEGGDDGGLSLDDVEGMEQIASYDVVEVLGRGGMGAVLLAQGQGTGEYVAIKVLLNRAAGELELGRFRREIDLTRRVEHQSVIHIIDAGETDEGLSYLVVPALAGKELRDVLDATEGEGLAPDLVVRVFAQILEGLEALHAQGIVHRDLKPENVFVLAGSGQDVKIMDLGLAKLGDDAVQEDNTFRTMQTDVVGSPAYMSPEAVTNDPMDGRTDLYSFGVLLFEALTGKLPLESETAQGFLGQHLISPPATLSEARPERTWDPRLEELLARLLAKTREERPESCRAVLEELRGLEEAVLASRSAPATPEAEPEAAAVAEGPRKWGFKGLLGRLWGGS